ncbi:MAG: recombinase family protein [Oscillospiraceae bacterium]|nr:recombinase family protein [Oscillospiraceae bacterium]
MGRTVKQVKFSKPPTVKLTRVAAYARVSSGKDAMLHSLSAQVSHYNEYIQKHPGWVFAGVYVDEALTGTKDTRANFQRLLTACRNGDVDLILTKSVSRFARNTVTLLETVRELKALGVDVYFEEQNIHSAGSDGELLLTILASYAQAESLSASENQKWRIKRNFENGKPWNGTMLGYRMADGQYVIVPEEAAVVRRIFDEYLSGLGAEAIAKKLNEEGIYARRGAPWGHTTIFKILRNYSYTGNLLLQTTYRENHITKKTLVNHGELPKYHATDTHEAIIPIEVFQAVQEEIARRAAVHTHPTPKQTYPFTGLITCACCGKHYRRKVTHTGPVWICATYNTKGKAYCASKQIPEAALIAMTEEVLGTVCPDRLHNKITAITADKDNTLIFTLADGQVSVKRWQDRSRAESWTQEMKNAARQKTLERNMKK